MIVGVEAAGDGNDAGNKWPGATFYSNDGGKTFELLPFVLDVDPTPDTSDEYLNIAYVPGS